MDKSSQIQFSIIGGDPSHNFKIDPKSGELSISSENGLSESGLVTLQVQASDGIFTDTTEVKLTIRDINNNAPVFDKETYSATVPEDASIGNAFLF
jgi:hypothetical protein